MLRRLHLFEWHELPWCPDVLRRISTDWLRTVVHASRLYRPVVPHIARAMRASGQTDVVDLCSGASGPLLYLQRQLEDRHGVQVRVLLTDLYPNVAAFEAASRASGRRLRYTVEPVDALRVPRHLTGFRTLFEALHHFQPEQVRAIFADAVEKGAAIGVFEVTERSIPGLLRMLVVPISVSLLAPFIRPFSWSRLFFTYVVPIAPLLCFFDGVVSSLRSYTLDELRELTEGLGVGEYVWEMGVERRYGFPITWMVGYPSPHVGKQLTDPRDWDADWVDYDYWQG